MKECRMILLATLMTLGLFTIAKAQATEGKSKGKIIMAGKPGTLAAPTNGNSDENKGWNGKCPDYLDCNTGEIQYFEYKKDMVVDAPEVCGPLGAKTITIAKGRYEVNRTSKNGATITVQVARWTPIIPKPRDPVQSFKIVANSPRDISCSGPGNSCFMGGSPTATNEKPINIIIVPVFENEACVALKITFPPNKSGRGTDPIQAGF